MPESQEAGLTDKLSFCRICSGICGTIVTVDRDERVVAVRGELEQCLSAARAAPATDFPFLLVNRRARHRFNSFGFAAQPHLKRMMSFNHAYMNPDDMRRLDIADSAWVRIDSDHGSISHGFGGLPDEDDYLRDGASPNLLVSTDRELQTINAMPRMSGIPVKVVATTAPRPSRRDDAAPAPAAASR